MSNTHRKTPEGYLAFGTVRDHLKSRGFSAEQIDHFASDDTAGKPDMIEIACRHQGHPQIMFSFELHHKDGMKLVREAEFNATFLPAVEAVKARKAQLQEEAQFNATLGQENAAAANAVLAKAGYTKLQVEADKGQMTLWHTDYPEFGLHAEFPRTPQLFDTIVASRAATFAESYLPDHLARLAELEKTRGITVERRPDALIFTQPELGVRKAIECIGHTFDAERWDKALQGIDAQINVSHDPQTMRLRLKRLAGNHGFGVDTATDNNGITTLTLTHPSPDWKPQSATLIGTHGIPGDAAMEMIAQAEIKGPALKAAPPPAALGAMRPKGIRSAAKPADIDLVVDTSILTNLECPREGDRTYLDMIRLVSTLPGVHVVIPSIVAWEYSGRIPHADTEHNRIDWTPFDLKTDRKYRREFFSEASHVIGDANGGTHIITGPNPNFAIWHSPQQDAFFKLIENEKKASVAQGEDPAEFLRRLRDSCRDIGEKTMFEYCHSDQSARHAVLAVEDNAFFQQFLARCKSYPRGTDTYTRNGGHAISKVSTTSLIRSLNDAYGDTLATTLQRLYGGKEADTTPPYILDKINEYKDSRNTAANRDREKFGRLRDTHLQIFRGRNMAGDISPPLNEILAQALARQRQHENGADRAQPSNGHATNAIGNGHSNGHAATPPACAEAASWQDRLRSEPPSAARDLA